MFRPYFPATPTVTAAMVDGNDETAGKGSFVTEQTLASFVGASAVVLIVWKLLARLNPETFGSSMNTVWIALVVGAAVLYLSWPVKPDGNRVSLLSWDGGSALIVGLFNSLILAAASIGIDASGVPPT